MTADETGTAEDEDLGVAHGDSGKGVGRDAAPGGILGDHPRGLPAYRNPRGRQHQPRSSRGSSPAGR
jgi:hypothetical protein